MEKFKIEIFENENKVHLFPEFQKISKSECYFFKKSIAAKVELDCSEIDSVAILNFLREKSKIISGVNADADNFNLKIFFPQFQISEPENIYVNWDQFENIDKFKFKDFCEYFKYIWYPGPDDIEIFPHDVSWIISIDATGSVYKI